MKRTLHEMLDVPGEANGLFNRRSKRRKCVEHGCEKVSQGKSGKCIQHGGGKRCVIKDCPRGAQGKTDKCKAHGGGKRCVIKDCPTC